MTAEQTVIQFSGHQPASFKGQKGAILYALLERRREWTPLIPLQNCARVEELRYAGYVIDSKTARVGGHVHGTFRLERPCRSARFVPFKLKKPPYDGQESGRPIYKPGAALPVANWSLKGDSPLPLGLEAEHSKGHFAQDAHSR